MQVSDLSPVQLSPAGEQLSITVSGSPVCRASNQGCTFVIAIDGQVLAPILDSRFPFLTVDAPAHARGTAMLTIAASSGEVATATLRYGAGAADNERILVPLVPRGAVAGANGSLWSTLVFAANVGPETSEIRGAFATDSVLIPHLEPGANTALSFEPPLNGEGAFVWIPRFTSDSMTFSSRVEDGSHLSLDWGTEIPIVREREFKTRIALLDVPALSYFRLQLRIYGYTEAPQRVRVVVRAMDLPDAPALEDYVLTTNGILPIVPIEMPLTPSYAQVSLDVNQKRFVNRLRVDVTSMDGQPLWAFVSITNNETKGVTVSAPH